MQDTYTPHTQISLEKTGNPTLTPYSAEEVIAHFQALYDSYDFKADLEELQFTMLQFGKRKAALQELRIVSVAFWYMALKRSFPHKATEFFTIYREWTPLLNPGGNPCPKMHGRLDMYLELLQPKGDSDFSPIAASLAAQFANKKQDAARLQLKLSLVLRQMYTLIFEKLV